MTTHRTSTLYLVVDRFNVSHRICAARVEDVLFGRNPVLEMPIELRRDRGCATVIAIVVLRTDKGRFVERARLLPMVVGPSIPGQQYDVGYDFWIGAAEGVLNQVGAPPSEGALLRLARILAAWEAAEITLPSDVAIAAGLARSHHAAAFFQSPVGVLFDLDRGAFADASGTPIADPAETYRTLLGRQAG
jgi:hypothetical protein